jgi:hypothetical protein
MQVNERLNEDKKETLSKERAESRHACKAAWTPFKQPLNTIDLREACR